MVVLVYGVWLCPHQGTIRIPSASSVIIFRSALAIKAKGGKRVKIEVASI